MHKSVIVFTFENNTTRRCLTTHDMYLSWICCHDPLQLYAKMGHLSREETIYFMTVCTERYDLPGEDVPSPCLALQTPELCKSGVLPKSDVIGQKHFFALFS